MERITDKKQLLSLLRMGNDDIDPSTFHLAAQLPACIIILLWKNLKH